MVKTSYPFFRAHELAEELCHNSKGILPADDSNDESVLDFHLVQGEIEGSITEIRREKYNKNTLTSKPFYLQEKGRKNSLPWFRRRLALYESGKFTLNAKTVEVGKGVLKEYRDALSAGAEAAESTGSISGSKMSSEMDMRTADAWILTSLRCSESAGG